MNFVGIVGTNASKSYNRKLLWYMKRHFADTAHIEIAEIADIPLFSEDISEIPVRVREIAHAIEEADGVIFSTPEYDHSITASLKNLLEYLSWGELHPLTNTPVMIVGVSLGNMGTVFAQENLKQILSSPGLDGFVLPSNQFLLGHAADSFDESEDLIDARTIGWLDHCFESFIAYSQSTKPLRHAGTDRTKEAVPQPKAVVLEEGQGWQVLDVSLLPKSDTDTGSSKHEDKAEAETGASKQGAGTTEVAKPAVGVEVAESGNGWWIEIIGLVENDSHSGASQHEEATDKAEVNTGASRH